MRLAVSNRYDTDSRVIRAVEVRKNLDEQGDCVAGFAGF